MKIPRKKFLSRGGETLVELLVGILIVAMAAFLLAALYSAARRIDSAARDMDSDFYQAISDLDRASGPSEQKKVHYEVVEGEETRSGEIEVDVYQSDSIVSYKKSSD